MRSNDDDANADGLKTSKLYVWHKHASANHNANASGYKAFYTIKRRDFGKLRFSRPDKQRYGDQRHCETLCNNPNACDHPTRVNYPTANPTGVNDPSRTPPPIPANPETAPPPTQLQLQLLQLPRPAPLHDCDACLVAKARSVAQQRAGTRRRHHRRLERRLGPQRWVRESSEELASSEVSNSVTSPPVVTLTPADKDACITDYESGAPTAPTTKTPTTASWRARLTQTINFPFSDIKTKPRLQFIEGSTKVFLGQYTGKKVAVKKLSGVSLEAQGQTNVIETAIAITRSLKHDNIVKFIGLTSESDMELMMVSECMAGGDLRTYSEERDKRGIPGGLDDEKITIALHIANALAFLHDQSPVFVRRSTTSWDVLLSGTAMTAKLYKLYYHFRAPPQLHELMYPRNDEFRWSAPEVLKGESVTEKADILSFGAILAELDTQELPYNSETNMVAMGDMTHEDLLDKIKKGHLRPRLSQDTDQVMRQIAMECLRFSPASRPSANALVKRIHDRLSYQDEFVPVPDPRYARLSAP